LSDANAADILKRIAKHLQARFIYLLYNVALLIAAPLISFYFLVRVRRDHRYARSFAERLGSLPFSPEVTPAASIWLHAVSVGEVLSAVEVVRRLRTEYPAAPVYVSVTTVAGRQLAEEKLRGHVAGLFYAPIDYRWCVRRMLRCLRPALVVILETEIWPNLYREVKRTSAALLVLNGRISDRALPRYRMYRWFFRPVLLWPDRILAQTARDRDRFIAIGASAERVAIAGNLKYDFTPATGGVPDIEQFIRNTAPAEVWIAASTMPPADGSDLDEDDAVIEAFLELSREHRALLLVLVPRRPERFGPAAAKLEAAEVPFVLRSRLNANAGVSLPGVLLLDTIGELSRTFVLADVVFMGGTLARRGGHNILEPAFFGKPVIAGPHMENFAEIAAEFRSAGAMFEISAADDLGRAVGELLSDASARERIGANARRVAESKRGTVDRTVSLLLEYYMRSVPCRPRSAVLSGCARLWELGTRWDQRRKLARQRRLDKRVVSIGNIAMGGSGKTPVAQWLASELDARGLRPAILTRGYRRWSPESNIVLSSATRVPPDVTGDEAQICLRRGVADVGIGADRYTAGRILDRIMNPDLFILDDGFQHWRLYHDVDVVLIDALDPFGGCRVFPEGRLREPLESLSRADAFVITRCDPYVRSEPIEHYLRAHNANAPIFRSRVVPRRWVNAATGEAFGITEKRFRSVAAFCGLANPASFRRSLGALELDVPLTWCFGDHHVYRSSELRQLAARAVTTSAEALVTTEKDAMNLPDNFATVVKGFPVYYLEIGIEMDDAARFVGICLG
jgi:tetraacyldisaccharide 4'-kinase